MQAKLLFYTMLFIVIACLGCGSVPKEKNIPLDATVTDLVQKAQECFDINNYRGARAYYEIIIKRFGADFAVRTAAEYEIAHILVKKRKWKDAEVLLSAILERYQDQGGMMLPAQFYKLAQIDYAKVQEKLKKRRR